MLSGLCSVSERSQGSLLDVPQWKNGYRKCGSFTQSNSAIKAEDIMSFARKWMELENIILSEVSQTQKDMHGIYSLTSGY